MDRNTPIVSQEEPLLTSEEAWQDYQSLKIALAEEAGGPASCTGLPAISAGRSNKTIACSSCALLPAGRYSKD
jgi:hypothetical protein